ncbi:MAG: filamentous hemagglutinin N-terminal domain-containing protein [Cyanobacteria bacterium P01_G01_bin.54]
MFKPNKLAAILITTLLLNPVYCAQSSAQITSDTSLGTTVSNTGLDFTVDNGTTSGTNLFHSFDQFSVPTGGSVTFNNSTAIANIFSRVTGGNVSNIDGLIAAQGTANLFLINPAGITFGENATLSLGGSFFASTAESVLFPNNLEFAATSATTPALLSINSPVGLNMGTNPGAITVQGQGHNFFSPVFSFFIIRDATTTGLQVNAGKTLALIGGEINFTGGRAIASSGQITLAGVAGGTVDFVENTTTSGYSFDYAGVSSFADINLSQKTALDISGTAGQGAIELVGDTITLTGGSLAIAENDGPQDDRSISVQAAGSLRIDGLTADRVSSGLVSGSSGNGAAADIQVNAENLFLTNSGLIGSLVFGPGMGGRIVVDITNAIEILGTENIFDATNVPAIGTATLGGALQSVNVTARTLKMTQGASITSFAPALSFGSTAAVNIQATDSIELVGFTTDNLNAAVATSINSSTTSAGDANAVTITTARLFVRDGASIATTTFNAGNAGNVTVNASELIQVSGTSPVSPSLITSGALPPEPLVAAALGLPPIPTGDSGNLVLNTPRLEVSDSAQVTVRNDGTGNAGTLTVNGDRIILKDQGSLSASTFSGEGGNIALQLQEVLLLRNESFISAEAGGTGNGGNITINAPFIVAVSGENSDIIANAFQGNGGNITITATGILGLEFRDQLTEFSDITASSQFGVMGTVTITNPNTTLTGLDAELQGDVLDPDQEIVQGCDAVGNSRFVATGRGGVPENPLNPRPGNSTWNDVRDLTAFRQTSSTITRQAPAPASPVIVEATGVRRDANGELELYAETAVSTPRIASTACTSTFHNN